MKIYIVKVATQSVVDEILLGNEFIHDGIYNFESQLRIDDPVIIYFGGDNVMFWGPLSWAIIFGLSVATFLTLILLPALYLIDYKMNLLIRRKKFHRSLKK